MQRLYDDGLEKTFAGLTTVDEESGGFAGMAWLCRAVHPRLGQTDRTPRQVLSRAEDAPANV